MPFTIVVADDHAMFRHGVRRILKEIEDIEVIGEAEDGLELLKLVKKRVPNMVILDLSMPNLRGIEAIPEIKRISQNVRVLVLTMHRERELLCHAITEGAEGYLLKDDPDTELINAVTAIRDGKRYLSSLVTPDVTELLVMKLKGGGNTQMDASEPLTVREREILKLVAEGKSNNDIAELLCISSRTVQHHRANLMKKLNVRKNIELVKYAIQKGYI